MHFIGSFKNRYQVSSNRKAILQTKILAKRGLEKIPLSWCKNSEKIPTYSMNELDKVDKDQVYGLYLEKTADLKNLHQYPNLVRLVFCNSSVTKISTNLKKATQVKYLQLSCENLRALPKELAELSNMQVLDLGSSEKLTDIAVLAHTPQLLELDIADYSNSNSIKNWDALKNTSIEVLKLKGIEIHYLGDTFSHLPQLKKLTVEVRFQKELEQLAGLPPLTDLSIELRNSYKETNKIANINALLHQQTTLQYFHLRVDEYFSDYTGFEALSTLTYLYLDIPNYSDVHPCDFLDFPAVLGNLTQLVELHITTFKGDENNDWSALGNLKNLKRLHLGSSPLTKVPTVVKQLTMLEEFFLERCEKINDLTAFTENKQLKALILEYCGWDNDQLVDTILTCTNLTYIVGKFGNRQRGQLTKNFKSAFVQSV